ncbi:hypothetical protein [Cohnella rhizosphaerae]|uniref:Uncharacterized protein n=1 Tax=Cohnella rhizosphaerae TaxID=1457232 RepID=A0A9X4QXT6_9BACL|nr:hypothetical protein [Cohnella rhizosphaerae]MDG0813867.1 hypothetical protein [Cohnella rhizosphaerae]
MGTIVYELKEHLNHHKYEWPLSLVRYPIRLKAGEAHPDSLSLRDEAGRRVPVQLAQAELRDGYVVSGQIAFLTDLPGGGDAALRAAIRTGPGPAAGARQRDASGGSAGFAA